jgi:hypothetical protein
VQTSVIQPIIPLKAGLASGLKMLVMINSCIDLFNLITDISEFKKKGIA